MADTIRTYLGLHAWTQAEAAKKLGVSQSAISYVKTGAIEQVGTDMLAEMLAATGLAAPVPPAWVDEAVRAGYVRPADGTVEVEPLSAVERRTYPGISPTELARIVGGRCGWSLHCGALYTADGALIASSLELAATAMQSLGLIDSRTGQLGFWVRVGHHGITEAVRAEADRLTGR